MVTIAIIVVSYKKPELVVTFCESLSRLKGVGQIHVLVVDNAADESSRRVLQGLQQAVHLDQVVIDRGGGPVIEVLHEATNWGYFGGARRGLEHLRLLNLRTFDWVIIANSDIEFPELHFVERLAALSPDGDIGVIGPTIISHLSGANQNPYMAQRPSAGRMRFYKNVFRNIFTCFIYQMLGLIKSAVKNLLGYQPPDHAAGDIYAPHGAFLIFSRAYFARGGTFEHQPFLFGEEVTVAETCRRLGLRARYEPSLVVRHVEHASIGIFPSRKMLSFQREASAFCADTYFRD